MINSSKLHEALKHHAERSGRHLTRHHKHAVAWFKKRGVTPGKIRHHAARLATSSLLASSMFLANPLVTQATTTPHHLAQAPLTRLHELVSSNLKALLPHTPRPLHPDEEDAISKLIRQIWGISASASLEGEHLNTSYGYMGAEQHLPRFPGDTVAGHDAYQKSGITPGRGAWGYFAPSQDALTPDLIEKEKYYVAVQTLYLPDWESRLSHLSKWYKYRKVLVINPANGKTIVAVVADAGPAQWTGKQFGGSPEVMAHLGLNVGPQKGAVVLFFVDDPDNAIPLGPVEYNVTT